MKQQILSCIQPTGTGEMHLGNYFGAIQNWVSLQADFNCLFGVVDYHAMTMPYNPDVLKQNTISMAINLIACGIEPNNLFIQSLVPEHTELAWILGCVTAFGELSRQTQFKDKSNYLEKDENRGLFVSSGLFTYPILQASDILIYHADFVPVGKDQEQHLELTRNIANRFNQHFQVDYFKAPKCLFTEIPKVMSLADPSKKMSKSLGNKHYIGLFEDEQTIRQKIRSAVTDASPSQNPDDMSLGVKNMFDLLLACGKVQEHKSLLTDYHSGNLKYMFLKTALTDAILDLTRDFKRKRNSMFQNKDLVEKRIADVSLRTREKAQKTLTEVRKIIGLR